MKLIRIRYGDPHLMDNFAEVDVSPIKNVMILKKIKKIKNEKKKSHHPSPPCPVALLHADGRSALLPATLPFVDELLPTTATSSHFYSGEADTIMGMVWRVGAGELLPASAPPPSYYREAGAATGMLWCGGASELLPVSAASSPSYSGEACATTGMAGAGPQARPGTHAMSRVLPGNALHLGLRVDGIM
jgi:hypothetical protein